MAQIVAVALHIGSRVVRMLQQDQTHELPPLTEDPARPQGLPSSSFPGLRVPRCIQARIHREPGRGKACDLLHCQQMKVCCSLGAVRLWDCSHGSAGHT